MSIVAKYAPQQHKCKDTKISKHSNLFDKKNVETIGPDDIFPCNKGVRLFGVDDCLVDGIPTGSVQSPVVRGVLVSLNSHFSSLYFFVSINTHNSILFFSLSSCLLIPYAYFILHQTICKDTPIIQYEQTFVHFFSKKCINYLSVNTIKSPFWRRRIAMVSRWRKSDSSTPSVRSFRCGSTCQRGVL